ncbi:DUF2599 domain-containing protein [Nocardia sp. X0981]
MPIDPTVRALGIFAVLTAFLSGCGSPAPHAPPARAPAPATTPATAGTSTAAHTPVPAIDPHAGLPLIDHIEWTHNADGSRLLVYPTEAGRATTFPGADLRAWAEIRAADPTAATPGMWEQFRCHWEWARLVAPDKPTWNLEPWRPPVGYDATVEAACNPGGPER